MKVRSSRIYTATQYNKRGDHPNEYVWSQATPILDELPGEENKWPVTGRLGTLDECKPENLRYSVFEEINNTSGKYWDLELGWWILERDGKVVSAISPERFLTDFEHEC